MLKKKREQQNQELMNVLEAETQAETARESQLREADDVSRRRLEKIYGVERAQASERIILISDKHDKELKAEMSRLGVAL